MLSGIVQTEIVMAQVLAKMDAPPKEEVELKNVHNPIKPMYL